MGAPSHPHLYLRALNQRLLAKAPPPHQLPGGSFWVTCPRDVMQAARRIISSASGPRQPHSWSAALQPRLGTHACWPPGPCPHREVPPRCPKAHGTHYEQSRGQ